VRSHQPQLARRQIADCVAVHGQLRRAGGWYDGEAFCLQIAQHLGADCLDFGDDQVGAVLFRRSPERLAIKHGEHLAPIGHLHRRGVIIAVTGDHPRAEALGGNHEFAAQLARTEQQDGGNMAHGGRLYLPLRPSPEGEG